MEKWKQVSKWIYVSRKVWFIVLIDGYPAVLFLQMLNNFFKKSYKCTKEKPQSNKSQIYLKN